ncbi:hypothetical protein MCOR25_001869 [Pyricularia grisea]|uniref:Uncharacterized protein n=1 Tax=Pyricularia grisea TaxID=148305 RepID=A0A6P8BC47_PYRGI|nr:uncharacterized protein PgNI_03655 [Pyricularia grisea]KAI6379972.1 hypothetical protein MCOR25_001869 [Pyricularia grisea]TLD13405.1 hypothetical protein PgNI_03655 [Pyricularia grisea]
MSTPDNPLTHGATEMASYGAPSDGGAKKIHLSTVSGDSRITRSDNLSLTTPRRRRPATSTMAWIKSATECLIVNVHHYKAQRRLTKKRRAWVRSSQLNISPIISTSRGPLLQQNTFHAAAVNMQKLASSSNQALSSNPATAADLKTVRRAKDRATIGATTTAEKRRGRVFDLTDIDSLGKALGESFKCGSGFSDPSTTHESNTRESHLGDHCSIESTAKESIKRDSYWEKQNLQHEAEIARLGAQADQLNRELSRLREVSQHNERFHKYYKRKYETTAHQLEGTMHALRLIDNVCGSSSRSESGDRETPITDFGPAMSPRENRY